MCTRNPFIGVAIFRTNFSFGYRKTSELPSEIDCNQPRRRFRRQRPPRDSAAFTARRPRTRRPIRRVTAVQARDESRPSRGDPVRRFTGDDRRVRREHRTSIVVAAAEDRRTIVAVSAAPHGRTIRMGGRTRSLSTRERIPRSRARSANRTSRNLILPNLA